MTAMKVRNPVDGTWVVVPTVGPVGPEGPQGIQGPMGISTVIVGNFGINTTVADLPVDGLLPVDWDGPGSPSVAYQMEIGQSLYYDPPDPLDPLDGHLFQYVSTTIDATGWIDIGLIQGPQGEQGIQGPEGPQGIEGPIGPADDEVHIGPDVPPLPTQELWFDTDDARLLGPYNLPDGGLTYDALTKATDLDGDIAWRNIYSVPSGKVIQFPNVEGAKIHLYSTTFGFGISASTLDIFSNTNIRFKQNSTTGTQWANIHSAGAEINSGHLYFPTDGHGVRFNGNGYVYKKVGSGMKLRKSTNNPMWQIENNDGSGGQDIVTVSGNQNVDLGTVSANSVDVANSHIQITGSTSTNSAHFYVGANSNSNGTKFTMLEGRRADMVSLVKLMGYQSGYSGSAPESQFKVEVGGGDDGWKEVFQAEMNEGDGQCWLYVHGICSSTHFDDHSSRKTKDNLTPVDPILVGQLMDRLHAKTYTRPILPGEGASEIGKNRPPARGLALDVEDVEEAGIYVDHLVTDYTKDHESRGFSIGGMLALAITEIKSLRARLAVVEGKCG